MSEIQRLNSAHNCEVCGRIGGAQRWDIRLCRRCARASDTVSLTQGSWLGRWVLSKAERIAAIKALIASVK